MGNKYFKILILIFAISLYNFANSQGNPGFNGNRKAIGYNVHIPIFKFYSYLNNEIYIEFSRNKHQSISVNFTYAPIIQNYNSAFESYFYDDNLHKKVELTSVNDDIDFVINDGYLMLQMYGIGAKYCFFYETSTIAAPIGLSFYLKGDLFFSSVKKKEFEFLFEENYSLSTKKAITNDLNNNYNPPTSIFPSVGIGMETKILILPKLFFKTHLETNISSVLLTDRYSVSFDSYSNDFTDYLSMYCKNTPLIGNAIVLGCGLGYLLK